MAEFYVYIGPHWFEAPGEIDKQRQRIRDKRLSAEAEDKSLSILQGKFEARHRPGDIVQVVKGKTLWDDKAGKWKTDCHNPMLVIIRVEGLKKEDALAYEGPHENVISAENTELLHRRRFWINLELLTLAQQQELIDHRRTSITFAQFNSHRIDKNE